MSYAREAPITCPTRSAFASMMRKKPVEVMPRRAFDEHFFASPWHLGRPIRDSDWPKPMASDDVQRDCAADRDIFFFALDYEERTRNPRGRADHQRHSRGITAVSSRGTFSRPIIQRRDALFEFARRKRCGRHDAWPGHS